jgi:hypothetical protein
MTKKFLALAKADIKESIVVKDTLMDMSIDPVLDYEGTEEADDGFCGEVMIKGTIKDNPDEKTLGSILKDYLQEHVEFAVVRHVEFRDKQEQVSWGSYDRTRKAS